MGLEAEKSVLQNKHKKQDPNTPGIHNMKSITFSESKWENSPHVPSPRILNNDPTLDFNSNKTATFRGRVGKSM